MKKAILIASIMASAISFSTQAQILTPPNNLGNKTRPTQPSISELSEPDPNSIFCHFLDADGNVTGSYSTHYDSPEEAEEMAEAGNTGNTICMAGIKHKTQ